MTLPWIRPAVRCSPGYTPGEQPEDPGIIKLNTNENPYPPSPRVLAALRDAVSDQLRLYPDPSAREVREEAARRYGVRPENVLVGNGSDELLSLIVRACVDANAVVVYPHPTYSLYDTLVEIQAGTPRRVPYGPNFAFPEELIGAEARVVFVCHPNSPSGTPVPIDRIVALAKYSKQRLVVVDEAYADFADENALRLVLDFDNVIVLRTLSKSFSLAGLRVGLAFGSADTLAELAKVKDSYNVSRLSLVGARAALADYEWMLQNVQRIRATRTRLIEALRQLGFHVPTSHANFVLARRPGYRLEGVYRELKQRGILVRYFDTPELQDALRITVGTDAEVDALLSVLAQVRLV